MKSIFKSFCSSFLPALVAAVVFVGITSAQGLPLPGTGKYDDAINNNIVQDKFNGASGSSENRLVDILKGDFVSALNIFIGALAIIWMAILAAKFISSQGEEEKITSYKKQFGYIILGLFVVSVSEYAAFTLLDPSDDILGGENQKFVDELNSRLEIFVTYFKYIAGGIIIIIGGLAGFTMVTAGDQDEKRQAEVKFIKTFILGTMSIVLAEVTVRVFSLRDPVDATQYTPTQGVEIGIIQITGIIKFVLSFFGGAAFFMIVMSALYFLFSLGQEEQVGRAKRMLIYSVVALLVASSSYALVSYVVANYNVGT